MGQIWVREFMGGLDARRLPECTPGGVLTQGEDGHITRGGDFEQRYEFVSTYDLPAGQTTGLAANKDGIVVFGTEDSEYVAVPSGVQYQQLVPDPLDLTLTEVSSWTNFGGTIYASAKFSDDSQVHYYGGDRVINYFDGKARVGFDITGGGVDLAISAVASFEITAGSTGGSGEITSISIDGVSLLSSAVAWDTDIDTTAAAVASAILTTTSPAYTAYSEGSIVYIEVVEAGAAGNGRTLSVTPGGDAAVGSVTNTAGGTDSGTSTVTDITVNGVSVLGVPVEWRTSNTETASAIVDAINVTSSDFACTATQDGTRVVIAADTATDEYNGYAVVVTRINDLEISPSTGLVLADGTSTVYEAGSFVRTISSKINALSGPYWMFSGIAAPTKMSPDATGGGFIDLSTYESGSSDLVSIAKYQNYAAVFAQDNIQVWYIDPDPTLYRIVQTLVSSGTSAPKSVVQFGDNDIFYLDSNGIRSLRARDSSNAAATNDVGNSIDPLVSAKVDTLTAGELANVIGLIEPGDKRFWLICKDVIYVLSYFPGSKVSAWTRYNPGFTITDALVYNNRVYLRSGDTIYVYGGLSTGKTVGATEAVVRLPYLDGDKPALRKTLTGIDVACRGVWEIRAYMDPENEDASDKIGRAETTTFKRRTIPANGEFNHISLEARAKDAPADGSPPKIGSVVIHFGGDQGEDN